MQLSSLLFMSDEKVTKLWHIQVGHISENEMVELAEEEFLIEHYKVEVLWILCFLESRRGLDLLKGVVIRK